MSEPEVVQTEEVVHRIVDFDVGGDGRTLHTRIIPWNTPATVSDAPNFTPYQESWAPGAFDKQLNAANRVDVLMNFEHEQGIGGVVGRGMQLTNEADGLHGVFRMLNGEDGNKALELVNDGVLTGLSVEAVVKRSAPVDGVVVRSEARLVNVALCRTSRAAFKDAQVLAVRHENEEGTFPGMNGNERERFVIPDIPMLDVERFEALGIRVPDRTPTDEEVDSPE
jgi:HK97 family phage prohead protease